MFKTKSDMHHRLAYLMEYIGYPEDHIKEIVNKMEIVTDDDLWTMCIINSLNYFSYPDGYYAKGLNDV